MDKTYVFNEPNGSGGKFDIMALLPGLMGNNGLDPNLAAALMNGNNNKNGWGDSWWIIIILLFFCGGFGGNGFGGFGGNSGAANALAGDAGRDMIMQAVQGNNTAINQLASTMNCSTQNIQNAICGLNNTLTQIGGQIGMTSQQIINEISSCCCQTQNAILTQGYENRLADCQQTNTLTNTMNNNTQRLVDQGRLEATATRDEIRAFRQAWEQKNYNDLLAEKTRLQTVLDLRDQQVGFSNTVNSAIAPVNARLAHVSHEVDVMRRHELPTYSQPYIPGMPVSNYTVPMCGGAYASGYNAGENNV